MSAPHGHREVDDNMVSASLRQDSRHDWLRKCRRAITPAQPMGVAVCGSDHGLVPPEDRGPGDG